MSKARNGLDTDGDFVIATSDAVPLNRPGEIVDVPTREGYRKFVYRKASVAFAIGQVAMQAVLLDNADVDVAQAITSKQLEGTGDFTANEFNDGTYPSSIVSIDVGAGLGQSRAILYNRGSTDIIQLDKVWDVALTTASDFVTQDLNLVALADTDVEPIIFSGVAVNAVTINEWSWFQIEGYCPLVRAIGSTDPFVRGEAVVPSATAGTARGLTTAATTADEIAQKIGKALHAYAGADVAGSGVAVLLGA